MHMTNEMTVLRNQIRLNKESFLFTYNLKMKVNADKYGSYLALCSTQYSFDFPNPCII